MKISRQVPPLLRELMEAALEAVDPGAGILDRHLPEPRGYQRICVLALGKAAASMAQAVERRWSVELDGVAVTRQGYERDLTRIELRVGTHPLPSRGSLAGGEALLRRASSLRDGDLALVLLSGGASALACVPIDGVEIEDIARWTRALLRGGATVHEINTVRRHLCQLKGGGLAAAAWPAHVVTLAISDVAGDAPESIGSGPTLPDPTTTRDAREVFAKYLSEPAPGFRDTVKSTDVRLSKTTFQLVATGRDALTAAHHVARRAGYQPIDLGADLQGEAREVGASHAHMALGHLQRRERVALLSGGELTVTVRGEGRGGPNQEYALAAATVTRDVRGIVGFAMDTDGVDGTDDIAGAWFDADTIASGAARGRNALDALGRSDAGGFFLDAGGLIVTGPTGTNVNDLRVILVDPVP